MKILINTIFLFLFSSHAFAWDRFDMVDDFSGEKSFGYLQKSSNNSGGYLIVSCNKKLKIEWDPNAYKVSPPPRAAAGPVTEAEAAAPVPAMPYGYNKLMVKTDEDAIRREVWSLEEFHYTLSPKNSTKFLTQLKNKSVLRLKNENSNQVGVFDISDLNQVVSNIKAVCN